MIAELARGLESEGPYQSITGAVVVGGGFLVVLALIGKAEWKDGRLTLHKGLPGIREAGQAISELLSKWKL